MIKYNYTIEEFIGIKWNYETEMIKLGLLNRITKQKCLLEEWNRTGQNNNKE